MSASIYPSRRVALATLFLAYSSLAHAWPERVVKIIVPAPAGGNMDTPARLFANFLSKEVGQPVIVENKAGAGGSIGVKSMLDAPPDGHTILFTSSNVLTEIPHVMKPPYDPMKDVQPVAALTQYRYVLVVGPEFPATDMASLARQLKASPNGLSYASPSPGTIAHFGGEILNRKLSVNMLHVPFSGSPPALLAVMGNQVSMYLNSVVTSDKQVRGNMIKALAVTGTTRDPSMPNVPTFAEQGHPEFNDFVSQQGIAVSPKVPAPVIEKLYEVTRRIASMPAFREQIAKQGFEPLVPQSPKQFTQRLQADFDQFAEMNRTLTLKR